MAITTTVDHSMGTNESKLLSNFRLPELILGYGRPWERGKINEDLNAQMALGTRLRPEISCVGDCLIAGLQVYIPHRKLPSEDT